MQRFRTAESRPSLLPKRILSRYVNGLCGVAKKSAVQKVLVVDICGTKAQVNVEACNCMLMLLFLVEGTSVHGSELLSLPSDFLCCKCAIEFRQSTVAELESDADAWKQKLQLRAGTSTTAVLEEREAWRVRDFLLRVAQTDEATGDSHEAFCELISKNHDLLSKSRCDALLNMSTKHSLGPFHYWHEPLAKYCQAMANCFGLVWEKSKLCTGRLRCPALQRDSSEPARWSDYTGRPGLVVEEVWKMATLGDCSGWYASFAST